MFMNKKGRKSREIMVYIKKTYKMSKNILLCIVEVPMCILFIIRDF